MQPRWLIIGLVASVALNLFLIGAAAGVIALGGRMAKEGVRPGALVVATQGLPPADRHAMRLMLRQARGALLPDVGRSLALRAGAWGAIGDAKPDVAAIKQQLAQSRQLDIAIRTRFEDQLVDYAAALTPSDRTIFAAGMRRGLRAPAAATSATPAPTNAPATNAANSTTP